MIRLKPLSACLCLVCLCLACLTVHAGGDEIALRLQPAADAPVVAEILATEKVRIDAAPVPGLPDWLQLALPLPLEGYIPTAALNKRLSLGEGTSVHTLPSTTALVLATLGADDPFTIAEAEDDWTRITFEKVVTAYFPSASQNAPVQPDPASAWIAPEPPTLELPTDTTPLLQQPDRRLDGSGPVSTLRPDQLPPENVVWKAAPRNPAPIRQPQPRAYTPRPAAPDLPEGIMVDPAETQAREPAAIEPPAPDQPLRRLTGILVREIDEEGPAYPIRLHSPEGRLIAFVDLSELFIRDLGPFLGQPVELRGPLLPLSPTNRQLVIFARELRRAE